MRLFDSVKILTSHGFNPRIRKGCDFVVFDDSVDDGFVSIHASVKDATRIADQSTPGCRLFQSTHP